MERASLLHSIELSFLLLPSTEHILSIKNNISRLYEFFFDFILFQAKEMINKIWYLSLLYIYIYIYLNKENVSICMCMLTNSD